MESEDELLEVVNEQGNTIDIMPRSQIHGKPNLIHKVVHVLVFNDKGDILLQKRSLYKDVAPGKWDTSVGGHMHPNETITEAAARETEEELNIKECNHEFLYSYIHSNAYETELVYTFKCNYSGRVTFNSQEIDEVRTWSIHDIIANLGKGIFSDNFEHEIKTFLTFTTS